MKNNDLNILNIRKIGLDNIWSKEVTNAFVLLLMNLLVEGDAGSNKENIKKIDNVVNKLDLFQKQLLSIEKNLGGYIFSAELLESKTLKDIDEHTSYIIPFENVSNNDYFDLYIDSKGNVGFKLKDDVTLPAGSYNFRFNYDLSFANVETVTTITFKLKFYNNKSDFINNTNEFKEQVGSELFIRQSNESDELKYSGQEFISINLANDLTNDKKNTYFFVISFYANNYEFDITYNPKWLLEVTNTTNNKTQKDINKEIQEKINIHDIDIDNFNDYLAKLESKAGVVETVNSTVTNPLLESLSGTVVNQQDVNQENINQINKILNDVIDLQNKLNNFDVSSKTINSIVSDILTESISGTATTQQSVNKENVVQINQNLNDITELQSKINELESLSKIIETIDLKVVDSELESISKIADTQKLINQENVEQINQNTTQIEELKSQIINTETSIDDLQIKSSSLQFQVSSNNTNINNLQSQSKNSKKDINTLNERIDKLENGTEIVNDSTNVKIVNPLNESLSQSSVTQSEINEENVNQINQNVSNIEDLKNKINSKNNELITLSDELKNKVDVSYVDDKFMKLNALEINLYNTYFETINGLSDKQSVINDENVNKFESLDSRIKVVEEKSLSPSKILSKSIEGDDKISLILPDLKDKNQIIFKFQTLNKRFVWSLYTNMIEQKIDYVISVGKKEFLLKFVAKNGVEINIPNSVEIIGIEIWGY